MWQNWRRTEIPWNTLPERMPGGSFTRDFLTKALQKVDTVKILFFSLQPHDLNWMRNLEKNWKWTNSYNKCNLIKISLFFVFLFLEMFCRRTKDHYKSTNSLLNFKYHSLWMWHLANGIQHMEFHMNKIIDWPKCLFE